MDTHFVKRRGRGPCINFGALWRVGQTDSDEESMLVHAHLAFLRAIRWRATKVGKKGIFKITFNDSVTLAVAVLGGPDSEEYSLTSILRSWGSAAIQCNLDGPYATRILSVGYDDWSMSVQSHMV